MVKIPILAEVWKKWVGPKDADSPPDAQEPKPIACTGVKQLPVFDCSGLMERVMHDESLAREVLDEFLETLPGQIALLKSHISARNVNSVSEQAHKIKGSCSMIGGEALRALTAAMEQAGKVGDMDSIALQASALDSELEALKQAIVAQTLDFRNRST